MIAIDGEYKIPLPWEVLDAAMCEKLGELAQGFVGFSHEVSGSGMSIFKLSQDELGNSESLHSSRDFVGEIIETLPVS